MLNYSINEIEGAKMLVLTGTLAADGVGSFRSIVGQITERESLIINFENVTMVTSTGLDALVDVSFNAKEHERRIIVLWADRDLIGMAETLGVYNYLIFAQSVDEARMKIKFFT
jgi:anti-anti-sigma regulatory factor